MHRSETRDLVACASCGAEVSLGVDRAYVFGEGQALCLECAHERGGDYDENEDRWVRPPDVIGLTEVEEP